LAEYNKALSLDPNDAKTLFNRGNTYLALRDIDSAHKDFDRAINIMPNNPKFYHSKGLAYEDTKQYEDAITMFKKALEVSPDHIPSLYHLGLMQHKNDKLPEALESLTNVLKEIGEDRLVYEKRGLVYQDIKNHRAAIQDFDSATKIEPSFPDSYYYRGLSKIELGKLGEATYNSAIEDFMFAEELGSKNPGIFNGIGMAFRLLKDYDKALYYLNEALRK
jgi:tetratricopeptide (TPR) repeat protein